MERVIGENKYRENFTAACVLALFLLIFFGNAIFTGKALVAAGNIFVQPFYQQYAPSGFTRAPNILLDDQHVQFYPQHHFVEQGLHKGEMPLWNPHVLLGVSVNGTAINGVFYPWNLFLAFLPLTVVLWLRAFLNLWIAGFFTFLFVHRLGGGRAGAYLSAISFMFCGFLVVWLGHPHVNAAVWLPVLLYLAELSITSPRFREIYVGLTGVVISLVFFAGHMETAFEVCLVWFLFYLVRCYQVEGRSRIGGNFIIALGGIALGVLLAAVQILPFLEWLRLSAEFAARNASRFVFFNWHHLEQLPSLIGLYLPNFLINPSQIDFPLICMVPWGNFNEVALYLGILPLIIGIQGFASERKKNKMIFLFGAGALFFLCLALRMPVFDWINQLPVFNIFAPRRWRLVFDFGMAVVAGLTLDLWVAQLADNKSRQKIVRFLVVFGVLAVVGVVVVNLIMSCFKQPILTYGQAYAKAKYLAASIHSRPLDQVLADVALLFDRVLNYFSLLNWRLYFPGLVLIAAAGLIVALSKKRIERTTFKYGILALTLLDLFVVGIGYTPVISPKDLYPNTPAIEFLKKDQSIFRILPVRTEWVSNAPMVYNISEMGGADLPTKYYEEFTDAIDGKDSQGFKFFTAQSANSRLIDLMNVKYIVTTNKFSPESGRNIRLCWQKDGVYIYENQKVLSRAFIVHKVSVIDEHELIQALRSSSFDPAKEVLFTERGVDDISDTEVNVGRESVDILTYKPKHIALRARSRSPGILVVSDAYYPGWRAYLDKKEVPIYRANGAMRAVKLPAGEHEVDFRYQPASIYIGGAISVSTFLLLVVAFGTLLVRNKR
jgi:hypothetical protein